MPHGAIGARGPLVGAAVGGLALVAAAVAVIGVTTGAGSSAALPATPTVTTTTPPPAATSPTSNPATTTTVSTTTAATTTTTSTTTPTTTTTSVAALPAQETAPIAPPTDVHSEEPVIELGRIVIPVLGVDMTMYEGIRQPTLDRGPGHWPGTAMPGAGGNVVVGGHRTSKHAVFRHLDDLAVGDQILFVAADGSQHVYAVDRVEIVPPSAVWIVDPTPTPTATLFACHPPGSTRERIAVFADYVETVPAPT